MKNPLFAVTLLAAATLAPAWAAEEPAYVLKADHSLSAVLKDFSGKSVTLHTRSGEDYTGTLTVVGAQVVQLSELRGKEFFDVIIAVDQIEAINFRARSR